MQNLRAYTEMNAIITHATNIATTEIVNILLCGRMRELQAASVLLQASDGVVEGEFVRALSFDRSRLGKGEEDAAAPNKIKGK